MSAHHLRVDSATITVRHDIGAEGEAVSLVVTIPEGGQATYRDDSGSLVLDVSMVLTADEVRALVALLRGEPQ